MADNNFENIKETFDYITEALDSMRAQSAMNAGSVDKVLGNINNRLEKLSIEDNSDMLKVFMAELKRSLEERQNFIESRFGEMESVFKDLEKRSENQIQKQEIKEVFEIIASNLNNFAQDFSSQKDLVTQIGLKIEELKQDDSQKKDIVRNIAVLKVELEKFGNGFESIILNLNDRFKELSQYLSGLNSIEALEGLKKDIENVFLSSNAILSTLQVIDRKNRDLEEVINHLVTKEDFVMERDQVAKLILQNMQITDYMNGLPTQSQMETLTGKIDTSIGIINALKNVLSETGKQNQQLLTAQLDNLESKILNISTEEEFIGFRKELAAFADQIIQSTNLMRMDLENTNLGIKSLYEFLNSMDIKNSFLNFSKISRASEEAIRGAVYTASDTISEEIGKAKEFIKDDTDTCVTRVNAKIDSTKKELEENSKGNLAAIAEHIQSVINNIFAFKNSLHIENLEHVEALSSQFQEIKEEMTTSNNFIVQSAHENMDNIISNVEKVYNEISAIKGGLGEASSKSIKNIDDNFVLISGKINEIKEGLDQSSKESYNSLLTIVENFSQEVSRIKNSLEQFSQENSEEIKDFIESLSGKLVSVQDKLMSSSSTNASSIKELIEDLTQETSSLKSFIEQSSNIGFATLKTDVEEISDAIKEVQSNFDIKSQSNIVKICKLFEDLTSEFNSHKEFLNESTQVNFESLSLCIQNLNKKMDDTKIDFDEALKSGFSEIQSSVSILPTSIKENRAILEGSLKLGFSELQDSISTLPQTIKEDRISLDSSLRADLAELQDSISDLPQRVQENSEFLNNNLKTGLSEIQETISTLPQTIKEDRVSLENALKYDFTEIQNSISTLPEKIKENQAVFEDEKRALLEENLRSIESAGEKVQELVKGMASKESSFKGEIFYEFSELKTALETLKDSLTSSGSGLAQSIDAQIKELINTLEEAMSNFDEKNNSALLSLQNKISEYFDSINQASQNSELKLENSLRETSEIKSDVKSIMQNLTEIKEDTSFEEVSSELIEKFDGVLINISKLEEKVESGKGDYINSLEDSLSNIISSLEENFDEISSDLKGYKSVTSGTIQEFLEDLESKTENIKNHVSLTGTDIVNILSSKTDEVYQLTSLMNQSLNKLLSVNVEELISDLKEKVDNSYFSIQAAIKENLKTENNEQLQEISQDFDNINERLDEVISKLSVNYAGEFDELKTVLQDVTERLDSIQESYHITTRALVSETIERVTDSSRESVLSKIEFSENRILESSEEAKAAIFEKINETQESIVSSVSDIIDSDREEFTSSMVQRLIENQKFLKSDIIDGIAENQSGAKSEIFDKIIEAQQNLKEILVEKLESEELTNTELLDEVLKAQEESTKILLEKFETGVEEKSVVLEQILSSQKELSRVLIENFETEDEDTTSVLDQILKTQEESTKVLLEKLESAEEEKSSAFEQLMDFQEDLRKSLLEKLSGGGKVDSDVLDKILESREETKTELLDKIADSSEDVKSAILEELKENIEIIKEGLHITSSNNELDTESISRLEKLEEDLQSIADEINSQLSQAEENHKKSTQALLSEVKTSFYEKVDDTFDELKSFVEVLEEKNNFNQTLDDLKVDVFDKFSEMAADINCSISSIDFATQMQDLNKEMEVLISGLFADVEEKFQSVLESSQSFEDILAKSDTISARIEELKGIIADEITEKLASFELSVDNQNKDFAALMEELKNSFGEFKENYADLSLNSVMELSGSFISLQEKVDKIQEQLDSFSLEDAINKASEKISEKIDNIDFSATVETAKDEIKSEFEAINQKLDLLAITSDSDSGIEEDINEIKEILNSQKDFFSKFEREGKTEEKEPVIEKLEETKSQIQETLKSFEEKLGTLISSAKTDFVKKAQEIKEEIPAKVAAEIPEFEPSTNVSEDVVSDLKEELSALKGDLFENIVEIFSQISFVEESEDIKDFVDDKVNEAKKEIISKIGKIDISDSSVEVNIDTQELKDGIKEALGENFEDILSSLDLLHEKAAKTDNQIQSVKNALEDDTGYSYTLQDVESDIAKIRMILKEKLESKEGSELTGIDRLSEDIMSISSRTNKLLLNSDESYSALANNLVEFKTIIYQLEEKIKRLDNTEFINKFEKRLENINSLALSSVQSDKIFNKTFMYLAEWIDKADTQMASISDRMVKTTDMEKLLDKFTKKFEKQEEKIKALEAKIDKLTKTKPAKETDLKTLVQEVLGKVTIPEAKVDTKLIKKVDGIDRQLATLGKSIEKITSYVDEE